MDDDEGLLVGTCTGVVVFKDTGALKEGAVLDAMPSEDAVSI